MKRILSFVLLFLLLFTACSEQPAVQRDGISYVVDEDAGTISDGTHTYLYTFSGTATDCTFEVRYPDGSSYWWQQRDHNGFGGWSDDYHANRYVDGNILFEVVQETAPQKRAPRNWIVIVLFLALGGFHLFKPFQAWQLGWGWRFKNAEPSDAAITWNRVLGLLMLLLGLWLLLF